MPGAELRFDGRTVVVTGAGRGVGRAHALLFASRGANVVVADLGGGLLGEGSSPDPANEVVAEIDAAGGTAVAVHASVAQEQGANNIVSTALDAFGGLDVVVNNAGNFDPRPFEQLTVDDFRALVEVHLFGSLFVIKAAWRHLVAAGYGRIVNTISEGMLGLPMLTAYGAAKGAVFGLTRTLALEGAAHGISVNAVAPRADTRMGTAFGEAVTGRRAAGAVPPPGMSPDRVSPAVAFLAHESCLLNGEVLQAGSGRVARLAMVMAPGVTAEEMTPELVLAELETITDLSEAKAVGLGELG